MKRIVAALLLVYVCCVAQDAGPSSDAFYSAIRDNDLAKLQALLKGGANPNVSRSARRRDAAHVRGGRRVGRAR